MRVFLVNHSSMLDKLRVLLVLADSAISASWWYYLY
jgi:hypothetical protein